MMHWPLASGFSVQSNRMPHLWKFSICIVILFISHISVAQTLVNYKPDGNPAIAKAFKDLDDALTCNSGLSIYDPRKGQWLIQHRAEDFFIPASNTKILTLYASLQILNPSLTAAYAYIKGDTIFVWGGADPGTSYPKIDSLSNLVRLLRTTNKTIVFSNAHFQTTRFGRGWAWDDHPNSYQCERNAYPIYGNRLWIDRH
ncbi:MAG TPA: D-alanyl-D-alanine carboxypeptidase, partial [Saprospiraceae bacterium]|nr:D-alanyl-D-alanine carboxypeptidase [Saprospiraceae bacterium]